MAKDRPPAVAGNPLPVPEPYPDLQAAEEAGLSLVDALRSLAAELSVAAGDDALILAAVFRWLADWEALDGSRALREVLLVLNDVRHGNPVGLQCDRRARSCAAAILDRSDLLAGHLSRRAGAAWAVAREALRAAGQDDVYYVMACRSEAFPEQLAGTLREASNNPALAGMLRAAEEGQRQGRAALDTDAVSQALQALNPAELARAVGLMLTALDCDDYTRRLQWETDRAARQRASEAVGGGLVRASVAAIEPPALAQLREDVATPAASRPQAASARKPTGRTFAEAIDTIRQALRDQTLPIEDIVKRAGYSLSYTRRVLGYMGKRGLVEIVPDVGYKATGRSA